MIRWSKGTNFGGCLTTVLLFMFLYSAWLTSIVFSAAHGQRPLLIASAAFLPVGIVHGIGIWFGGWA